LQIRGCGTGLEALALASGPGTDST